MQAACLGLDKYFGLRAKLQAQSLEAARKKSEVLAEKVSKLEAHVKMLQTELRDRPFQKYYEDQDDLQRAAEDWLAFSKDKKEAEENMGRRGYSGALDELVKLQTMFANVEGMRV